MNKKRVTCWYCQMNGRNILDEHGRCKRCQTNLKKYPTRESHPYPDLSGKLEAGILGSRRESAVGDEDWASSEQNNW